MQDKIQENPMSEEKKCCLPCCSFPWWKIVVCVILGLLVVGGAVYAGYFLGRKSLSRKIGILIPPTPIVTPSSVIENQPSLTPEATIDETKDGKIYRNEKYGFSFKYPSNWKELSLIYENYNNSNKERGFRDECLINYSAGTDLKEVETQWGRLGSRFYIEVSVTNPENWSLDKWIKNCRNEYEVEWSYIRTTVKVGERDVVLLKYDGNPGNGGIATDLTYIFENNHKFYAFRFINHKFDPEIKDIPEKLLKTLVLD